MIAIFTAATPATELVFRPKRQLPGGLGMNPELHDIETGGFGTRSPNPKPSLQGPIGRFDEQSRAARENCLNGFGKMAAASFLFPCRNSFRSISVLRSGLDQLAPAPGTSPAWNKIRSADRTIQGRHKASGPLSEWADGR